MWQRIAIKNNEYWSQQFHRNHLQWASTRASSSTINLQWSTIFHQFQERAYFIHLRRIRQVRHCLSEHCLQVLVQALTLTRIDYTASLFWLVFLKRLCSHWRLSYTLLHVLLKILNHATKSRPHLSNCTGFQFMPEFSSRSVSSYTIYRVRQMV